MASASNKTSVPSNANEGCVGPSSDSAGKAAACAGCPNQKLCASGRAKQEDPALKVVASNLEDVKHTILVLSGKGGVGKSTVSTQLALSLARQGKEVGLLDIDLCGPSIPRMLGIVGEQVHKSGTGWSPVYVNDIAVMSIGFLLPNNDAPVIWRGPRKNGLIKQFLMDVEWGELDYLIIDTPPGTSDEHISMAQYLKHVKVDGAVVVTTPQEVAMSDVRKELNFCKRTKIDVIGVVENMSGMQLSVGQLTFVDPDSGKDCSAEVRAKMLRVMPELGRLKMTTSVFHPSGGGPEAMAKAFGVPFLGRIPLDSNVGTSSDIGAALHPDKPAGRALQRVVTEVMRRVEPAPVPGGKDVMEVEEC